MAGNVCKGMYTEHGGLKGAGDKQLLAAVAEQQLPSFWATYRNPQSYAAMRRWGSYLRREARKRGLL